MRRTTEFVYAKYMYVNRDFSQTINQKVLFKGRYLAWRSSKDDYEKFLLRNMLT